MPLKYSFKDDYSEGCHPSILQNLQKHNFTQKAGYGLDLFSLKAKKLIRQELKNKRAAIHFVSGGTQANLIIISSLLKPHESVIAAHTGHITTHEAGAIEATGHKVNSIITSDGKVRPKDIEKILQEHQLVPHMVKPKMVYISNSTELGGVYKKQELKDLYNYCQKNNLILYMDGARLGAALTAPSNDLDLAHIAQLTDIFYIGGTKNGALLGEAIVINNTDFQTDFDYFLKQKGALLSKGSLLGIQFLTLFENKLFYTLSKHANEIALQISQALQNWDYSFLTPPESNQLFPIFPRELIFKLQQDFDFYIWQDIDDQQAAIRLVTSWATPKEEVTNFLNTVADYQNTKT